MPEPLADIGKDMGHAHGQGDAATRAMGNVQPDQLTEDRQIDDGHLQFRIDIGGGIDSIIIARIESDGGEQGHDAYESLCQHGAVADKGDLCFMFDHLRRRSRSDEGVESRNSAAGDGNEHIGPPGTGDDRTAARQELCGEGHLYRRVHEEKANRQGGNDADLHEGAEIVPRGEEEPDGNGCCTETIERQKDGHFLFAEGKPGGKAGVGNKGAYKYSGANQDESGDGSGKNRSRFDLEHVDTDAHRDGNRHGNGEDAPGIVEQGVDHGYTQPGQSDDDDEEDYDRRYAAGDLADILFGDDRQGLSLVAIGCEKNNHVMNATGKDASQQNPEKARSPAILGGQNRSNQWPRTGDGGKMMAENDPLIGGDIILAVIAGNGR